MDDLEALLQEYPTWRWVLSIPNIEEITGKYVMNYDIFNKWYFLKLLRENTILSKAIVFHEMIECAKYLSLGFTREEIMSGVSLKKYREAHQTAKIEEYKLYQYFGTRLMDKIIPLHAYAITHPFID